MSLLHNPTAPYTLESLDVCTLLPADCPQRDHRNIAIANATIYLTCMFALGHGHREVMPFAAIWSKCTAALCLTDPAMFPGSGEWLMRVTNLMVEESLNRGGMGAVVPLDAEGIDKVEVLKILTEIRPPFPEDVNDNLLFHIFVKAGVPKRGIGMMKFIGKCVACSSMIASMMYDASQTAPDQQGFFMPAAVSVVHQTFGNNFAVIPSMILMAFNTCKASDLPSLWKALTDVTCRTGEAVDLARYGECSPVERALRRASGGVLPPDVLAARDRESASTLDEVVSRAVESMQKHMKGPEPMSYLLQTVVKLAKELKDDYVPVSFLRPPAYEKFVADGRTKTVWDLMDEGSMASSWHSKYSDVPLHGRSVTDKRIYGERGDHVVYAILVHRGQLDQMEALAGMYGPVAIFWKPEVLDYSTLCINDSSLSPWVVPATEDNLLKHIVADSAPRVAAVMGPEEEAALIAICGSLTGNSANCNFIELQIHNTLTPDMITEVHTFA